MDGDEPAGYANVIGQDEAQHIVANGMMRRARAWPARPQPLDRQIFCSPIRTGVGKTEYDQGARRISVRRRAGHGCYIDMKSEFAEKHRPISSDPRQLYTPGYVGYGRGRCSKPKCAPARPTKVILFDEVQKAHEDVFSHPAWCWTMAA